MSPQRQLELEFSESIGRLELSLRGREHLEFRSEMQRFLKRIQTRTRTESVRREMARRVAEVILSRACMLSVPEKTMVAELQRMNRLGFSSIDRRVHIAAMLGRWVQLSGGDSPRVRPFIADAESRVLRVRRGRFKRELMESIERAKARTGMLSG